MGKLNYLRDTYVAIVENILETNAMIGELVQTCKEGECDESAWQRIEKLVDSVSKQVEMIKKPPPIQINVLIIDDVLTQIYQIEESDFDKFEYWVFYKKEKYVFFDIMDAKRKIREILSEIDPEDPYVVVGSFFDIYVMKKWRFIEFNLNSMIYDYEFVKMLQQLKGAGSEANAYDILSKWVETGQFGATN